MHHYVELHARSAFSFLRGGSSPEAMAKVAGSVELAAVALCDRGGVYGAVRFHLSAKEAGVRALVGCEVLLDDDTVVPVLCATQAGYRRLGAMLTTANLRAPKGEGRVTWDELATDNDGLFALTGDEDGPVRRAWLKGKDYAARAADKLLAAFGPNRLFAEIQRQLVPGEEDSNEFIVDWARARGVPLLATNGVNYATRGDRNVADVFTCLREKVTLDQAGRKLARNRERHLKPAREMHALFADIPEAIHNTVVLAGRIEFTLENLGYRFPDYPVPTNDTQDSFLKKMAYFGAHQRYGSVVGNVRTQIDRELTLIAKLGFSGYFLIVWGICVYAREKGYLVQGRGSAANSAVCYSLGITAVDPIASKLLFERFLSEGRSDWPDIDLDLPSGDAREDIIQEVYRRYGRRGAAMTANVITFRGRSTMRSVGKVMGLPDDVLDRFASLFHGGDFPQTIEMAEQLKLAGITAGHPRLGALLDTCVRVHGLPQHLGQHSGGMVLCAGQLDNFVPLENARMPGRSVLQWDKSDCEDMHIIKVDLLGLGMMAVLQDTLEICTQRNKPVDLARIPKDDPATFKLLQAADTVGLFQVESRAQIATLPRMKPATFYDVAIEVAIIRPGPIQGNAVNPYLERRAGKQTVTYPDERARPILERTLGVVLFQEQILRIAMELGGFTASEADELRRAIGFTRSQDRLNKMKDRLAVGLKNNGVSPSAVESIQKSLESFALYGFPESHAISFALIAYASAWLKVHRAPEFYAGLLNNQPMGFYSPATLVQDARRHNVKTLPLCVLASDWRCQVVSDDSIRLGFLSLSGLRQAAVVEMLEARRHWPFISVQDFLRRTDFTAKERRALSKAGALNALSVHRRAALWAVETTDANDELFRWGDAQDAEEALSPLERMTHLERIQADYETMSLTTGRHPMHLLRAQLPGLCSASDLAVMRDGARVKVGGAVITRQRPGTAKGFCFITLEDETGHINAIVRPPLFEKLRMTINLESSLLIVGRLQNEDGVIHVMSENIEPLPAIGMPDQASHDYH